MASAEVKHWRKIGAPVLLVNMKIILTLKKLLSGQKTQRFDREHWPGQCDLCRTDQCYFGETDQGDSSSTRTSNEHQFPCFVKLPAVNL